MAGKVVEDGSLAGDEHGNDGRGGRLASDGYGTPR